MKKLIQSACFLLPALAGLSGLQSAWAQDPEDLVVSNLLTNPGFASSLSGWFEEESPNLNSFWSAMDVDDHPSSGSLVGVTLANASNGLIAWQCLDVVPGEDYLLAFRARRERASNHSVQAAVLRLYDISGQPCPENGEQPSAVGEHIESVSINPVPSHVWELGLTSYVMPAGVTRVAVAARVCCAYPVSGSDDDDFGAYFDNMLFGKLAADLSIAATASHTSVVPNQPLTFNLALSNAGTVRVEDPDVRIYHGGRLDLDHWLCSIGTMQNNGTYFSWEGLPAISPSGSLTCSVTARALPGPAGTLPVDVVADCSDCDLTPADNQQHFDIELLARPEISPQLDVTPFPEAGGDVVFSLSLTNAGTAHAITSVTLTTTRDLDYEVTELGECANFVQSDSNVVSGTMLVSPGGSADCEFEFRVPVGTPGGLLEGVVSTVTTGDYESGNNEDSVGTQLVELVVNRSIDGWDGSPGDGICESSAGNDDCSLRAAVMEANALAAATGRTFTVKVPYSLFSYTLTRTSGDDESLHGSLKINRRMRLLGIPDEGGNLPFVVGSFPSADADRLIRIGNPASFVRIENLQLQGQGLVPTDTDGQGTDGGLILHRSGELVLSNVTLADGLTDGSGGAIHSASDDVNGHLTLERVRMFDNQASDGGGLTFMPESFATLSIIDSNIHDNQANAAGGGILVWNSGGGSLPAVAVQRSTLHGNAALLGGGGYIYGAFAAQINNSTVSGNIAQTSGGGITVGAATALEVNNSTIAFNEAGPGDDDSGMGGGLYVDANAAATLYNSIVSSNSAKLVCSTPNPPFPPICLPQAGNCYGTVDSAGFNAMAGDSECTFNSEPSDDTTHVQLEPLADNGGLTPTHAPASFNWIVDAGDPTCLNRPGGEPLLIDQRGALRPADGNEDATAQCDRGAYELSDNARVSVAVDDGALGQIQSSPSGIWCGAGSNDTCSTLFSLDAEVVLTASVAPESGGEFIGWEGACAGQGAVCTVTAAGNVQTTALFVLANQPDFLLACNGGTNVEVPEGGAAQFNCSVESVNGYSQPVSLLCLASVTSIGCHPSSASVTPPVDGSQNVTMSIDVGQTPPGDYLLLVEGSDGERVRQAGLALTVTEQVADRLFSDRFEQ